MTVQLHTAPMSSSNLQMTTVIGLITDNDETAYREEVSTLTKWCQENHLSLNIDKTKETKDKLVVDFRRQSREHTPITIDKTPVERVNSFKFLGIHITEDLTWSAHTDAVLKKAHQRASLLPETAEEVWNEPQHPQILLHLHCGEHPDRLHHRLVWKQHRWQPQGSAKGRANCPPHCWRRASLPPGHLHRRCTRKAWRIIKDSSHPSHSLLSLLPSGRRLRSIRSRTSRLRDSFFPSGYQANEQSELIHPTSHSHLHNMPCIAL